MVTVVTVVTVSVQSVQQRALYDWPTVVEMASHLVCYGSVVESPVLLVLSVLTPPLATPSSSSRLVGFDSESKELNADVLRKYIFGGHVADYMRVLEEEDEEKYKSHFAKYIEKGITADKVGGWSMACSLLLR